jgi:hypothetical protein
VLKKPNKETHGNNAQLFGPRGALLHCLDWILTFQVRHVI